MIWFWLYLAGAFASATTAFIAVWARRDAGEDGSMDFPDWAMTIGFGIVWPLIIPGALLGIAFVELDRHDGDFE